MQAHTGLIGFFSAAYPGRRFALPRAISFCPFGADGSIPAPPGFPWSSPWQPSGDFPPFGEL
jgi:hypothetical protein